jgi:IS1 family transposase
MKINNFPSLEEVTEKILSEYTLIPHTRSSRLFSTVRRMKAEKELNVSFNRRTNFVISTKTGHRTNEMAEQEWEEFYEALSNELKTDYPDIYARLFSPGEKLCGRCGQTTNGHSGGWWMACGALYGKRKNI